MRRPRQRAPSESLRPRMPRWLAQAWQMVVFRRASLAAWLAWPFVYPAAWLWRRTALRRTQVWAVTGSLGKTSTAAAAAAAAGVSFDPDRGNYGSFLAAALLRRRPGQGLVVVEVAISRPGQMRSYARLLRPDLVVLTAIGTEHLHAFADREELAREKALLPRAVGSRGLVVVNGDDPRCRAIGAACAAPVVRVGAADDCDWRVACAAEAWPGGTRLRLAGPAGASVEIASQWVGPDLPRCAALGAAAALAAGVAAPSVAARLAALAPLAGRMERLPLAGGAWLLQDAWKGHWPTTESALRYLGSFTAWRRVAVLGALDEPPGTQGAAYRQYGSLAAAVAHRLLFVGSTRDFERLRAGVREQGPAAPKIERYEAAHAAAAALRSELAPGTMILLKGRHSQKLGRVAALLRGEGVSCRLRFCPARGLRCELCPRFGNLEPRKSGGGDAGEIQWTL
jgi:UDP-N-acetylmuramoyl-tripeptide--D-alanyl-D-alanine ligase